MKQADVWDIISLLFAVAIVIILLMVFLSIAIMRIPTTAENEHIRNRVLDLTNQLPLIITTIAGYKIGLKVGQNKN